MGGDIDKRGVERAYARWAPIYDFVFGKVFAPGRNEAIIAAEKVCGPRGGRILEVGVGTGISLPDYASVNKITGVDLCEPMLRKAQEKVEQLKLTNIETLSVMDAENMAFEDGVFDVVVAQFVITTVPHPEKTLDEFARLTRPGGEIILVNHLGADGGPRKLFETCFSPLARWLGWRPEFPFAKISGWAECHGGVRILERRALPPMGNFTLIRFERLATGVA
jgi:phosphatidylethanolamine/phosphatidyl-N-methylethanolamine N-methyltransferase